MIVSRGEHRHKKHIVSRQMADLSADQVSDIRMMLGCGWTARDVSRMWEIDEADLRQALRMAQRGTPTHQPDRRQQSLFDLGANNE